MNYQMADPQARPHQLPLHSSNSEVNGALTREVKTWNPFEDTFTQMSEDHLFGQEFDKIRQTSECDICVNSRLVAEFSFASRSFRCEYATRRCASTTGFVAGRLCSETDMWRRRRRPFRIGSVFNAHGSTRRQQRRVHAAGWR